MPDASPTRWHLAHTTWFFETFVLRSLPGYEVVHPQFEHLFNSYYNSVGTQFPRPRRGLLSRPGLHEVRDYRRVVDQRLMEFLETGKADAEQLAVIELGLHHEQQHQELILTDIKHMLAQNPLLPAYRPGQWSVSAPAVGGSWIDVKGGLYEIGHAGEGFAFDNESPRHQVSLADYRIQNRPVTCGEYLEFVETGGYLQPEHWLSLGWNTVQTEQWKAPLYWIQQEDKWHEFTLAGLKPLDLSRPVCHLSYFEADAYARWSGRRLPTETEWEVAAGQMPLAGNFADTLATDLAIHPQAATRSAGSSRCSAMSGNGLPAPMLRIRVIGRPRGRWANTTESSCAISTCCGADQSPHPAATFAGLIAISSRRKPAGSSPACGWRPMQRASRRKPDATGERRGVSPT